MTPYRGITGLFNTSPTQDLRPTCCPHVIRVRTSSEYKEPSSTEHPGLIHLSFVVPSVYHHFSRPPKGREWKSSFDIAFPFSCSPPSPSGSSKKMSYTNGHLTILLSLWTRRDKVLMRIGATNVFWSTKKKDVRARHVLKGHFSSRRQVLLGPGMTRIMERMGMKRDEEGAKEHADSRRRRI